MIGAVIAVALSLSSPGCGLVPASQIKAVLGVSVSAPTTTKAGPVVTCAYARNGLPNVVIVRFQTGMTAATFGAARKQFDAHGEKTVTVKGIGARAFSSTLGKGAYAVSTLVVLDRGTELLITGPAPLAKVESLAKKVLAKL